MFFILLLIYRNQNTVLSGAKHLIVNFLKGEGWAGGRKSKYDAAQQCEVLNSIAALSLNVINYNIKLTVVSTKTEAVTLSNYYFIQQYLGRTKYRKTICCPAVLMFCVHYFY